MDRSTVRYFSENIISAINASILTFFTVFIVLMACAFSVQVSHAAFIYDSTRIIPVPTSRPTGGTSGLPSFTPAPRAATEFPNQNAILKVNAIIDGTKAPVQSGLIWRIFSDKETAEGKLALLSTSSKGSAIFDLPAGYYNVHASFGYAEHIKRVRLTPPLTEASFNIAAGGLRLNAAFNENYIIPTKDVRFEIARQEGGELKTIITDLATDEIVRLATGDYNVTSKYGDINSEVTATVQIKSGELTELTLYQRGAEITLKLVSETGGEALADTSWTVLTPGGDPVVNTVKSAFPRLILAAGDYVAFARNEGKNYSTSFTVESGIHRDVEVILGDIN
ncbi:MAG: hypothetical protein ABJM86_06650 [Hyphomicrobiales bacterium]